MLEETLLKIDLPVGSYPASCHTSDKYLLIDYILPSGYNQPVLINVETKQHWKIVCEEKGQCQ